MGERENPIIKKPNTLCNFLYEQPGFFFSLGVKFNQFPDARPDATEK